MLMKPCSYLRLLAIVWSLAIVLKLVIAAEAKDGNMNGELSDDEKELLSRLMMKMVNSTTSPSPPPPPTNRVVRNILISLFYSLIVIVSFCGNLIVCKTVICHAKMRNSTNILIATLAFSDLLMTVFNIPFTVVDILLSDWLFGHFFCIVVSFVQANCVYVSSFTMAVIAINRYRAVYKSQQRSAGRTSGHRLCSGLLLSIAFVWCLASVHSLPHTIFNTIIVFNTTRFGIIRRCQTVFPEVPDVDLRLMLTLETLLTQYIVPLSLAAVIYIRIGLTIYQQGRVGERTEARSQRMSDKKRRRIIMLVLVVVIFALCWLPLNVYYLLVDFGVMTSTNFWLFIVCHWFAMSSVCYNPFVYCWLNDSFRREAKKMWKVVTSFTSTTTVEE